MAEKALVTGGAGFIGSHLTTTLVERGYEVTVLDNLSTGKEENLSHLKGKIEFVIGDLRDGEACERACEGKEIVFHLGALGSVPRSIENPLATNDVNANGTLNLLVAARNRKARRVVFSSSSSVYGDTPTLPKIETMPLRPFSPYAASKLAGEAYCQVFSRTMGLETVVLRYFNVFGPRQDPESQYAAVIPRFIHALLAGTPPLIYGDGLQSRDFTFVSNVIEANILASKAEEVAGEVFNVACGEQITLLDMLKDMAAQLGREYHPEYLPARRGDVKHSRADIQKAIERLGYEPRILFEEGMRRTVQAYLP